MELAPGGQEEQGGLECSQLEIVEGPEPPLEKVHPDFASGPISLHHFLAQLLALFVPPGIKRFLKEILFFIPPLLSEPHDGDRQE